MLDGNPDSWVVHDAVSLRKRLEDRQLEMARWERTLSDYIAVEPSELLASQVSGALSRVEQFAPEERRAEIAGLLRHFRGVELSFREFEVWFGWMIDVLSGKQVPPPKLPGRPEVQN
jgi:hypothetical protein